MDNEPHKPDLKGVEMKMPDSATSVEYTEETSILSGALIAALAVLLLAVLAGLYYWFLVMQSAPEVAPKPITRPTVEENNEPESETAEAQVDVLETMSTSDDLGAIESDLLSTDLESLDEELITIENEFEATVE